MTAKRILLVLSLFILSSPLPGCANPAGPNNTVTATAPTTEQSLKTYPLLWEPQHSEGKNWSDHVYDILRDEASTMVPGTKDVELFCPRYSTLSATERINFWALLISAMAKYESGFDPLTRLHETTLGIDPVTKKPVYSEGLLQLSYQDTRFFPFCEFDWEQDKLLHDKDPNKTILNPYLNLSCGVKIFIWQVKKWDRITLGDNAYWSVIKIDSRYSKIEEIAALTKKMPGCM